VDPAGEYLRHLMALRREDTTRYTPGFAGLLREDGFRKVITAPGMREPYYGRIGFTPVGDRYELELAG
jgi:hypothetical protein